ncbi:unnamed protein product, partial [Oppiella nova]
SSSGVGAATAIKLAKAGAKVVITGRYALKLNAVSNECLKVSPNKLKPLEVMADITVDDDCKRLVQTTVEKFGKIDILVNYCAFKEVTYFTDKDFVHKFRHTFDLTLKSLVFITHLCVEHLEATKGVVVNISSGASFQTTPGYGPHCMAKSALDMFTRCMAAKLALKGIRVNSINHGALVDYQFTLPNGSRKRKRKLEADAVAEGYGRQYPVGRPGTGDDVGNAVLYLASKNSSFVTGINFIVDGGHLAAGIAPIVKLTI